MISSIYLANLCEEDGDYRSSIQIMRSVLSRIIETREHRIKCHVEYANNPTAAMSVNLHSYKIENTKKNKNDRYKIRENLILRKERERMRAESGLALLDEDEAEEATKVECLEKEKLAFKRFMDNLKQDQGDSEGDQDISKEKYEKGELYQFYTDIDNLLNDLHIDVLE